jgi:hypothetical protein
LIFWRGINMRRQCPQGEANAVSLTEASLETFRREAITYQAVL